jgi:hypothetical protein
MSPAVMRVKKDDSGAKGIDELLMSRAALAQMPVVPSVVMNEGTLKARVITPFKSPIDAPTARQARAATKGSRPPSASFAMTMPLNT